jgi:AraC-like DNA-binding protein
MVVVMFDAPKTKTSRNHYLAAVTSPDVPHCDLENEKYYCVLIEKEYFEEQYQMYERKIPIFKETEFLLCYDILKALNTFAFECGKNMPNSNITLTAQTAIMTHWIIRSIIGENLDMRSISSDYSVARVQHFLERHFQDDITVKRLAELTHISPSSLNRAFKKGTGVTPIEYLIEVRVEKSKTLLRRKDIPMIEIAERCGFGSSAHFSSSFKRLTNATPSEYRNSFILS